jgi:predicted Ser/Thr protein kinase
MKMEDFKSIIVSSGKKVVKIIENQTSYPLIGKGKQGAVFKISLDRCVKIFAEKERCLNESKVLISAQEAHIVPTVYEVGTNYIVMEYIDAPTLEQYFEAKGFIPEFITMKILFLFKEMKRLNFTRLDAKLRHIFLTNQEELIVIDHANSFLKIDSVPRELFKDLNKFGLSSAFLEQVKIIDPESYLQWRDQVDFKKKKHKK